MNIQILFDTMSEFEDDSISKDPIEHNKCIFKFSQIKRNIEKFAVQINNYIERQRNIRKNIILVIYEI